MKSEHVLLAGVALAGIGGAAYVLTRKPQVTTVQTTTAPQAYTSAAGANAVPGFNANSIVTSIGQVADTVTSLLHAFGGK